VNLAHPQHAGDQDEGTRRGARARWLIGPNPGAPLITLFACLAFALSVVLWFTDSRQEVLFTGLWVPSILALRAFYTALRRHLT
jgi:hypothetical protein